MYKIILYAIIFLSIILTILLTQSEFQSDYHIIILNPGHFDVIDGDTIKYNNTTYRDIFIDTPEKTGSQKKQWLQYGLNPECMREVAIEARDYLKSNLYAINITSFGIDNEIRTKDRFGRYLVIFLDRNMSIIGLNMVRIGLAFCYYRENNIDRISDTELRKIANICLIHENYARTNRLGVWAC